MTKKKKKHDINIKESDIPTIPTTGPVLTIEEIKAMMENPDLYHSKKDLPKHTDERTGTCVYCGGEVIAKVTHEYFGDPMHMIIGPGGANQLRTVHHGFHCKACGLKYEFPPKKD